MPKVLVQAVKRNRDRFPEDFMFQLSAEEFDNLKSQIVTSSWGGMRRARPYAFNEQGVAMLSSVLRSKRAVQVNIEIMRSFVRLREILSTHKDLAGKFEELEKRIDDHNEKIMAIFEAIRQLMTQPESPRKRIVLWLRKDGIPMGLQNKKGEKQEIQKFWGHFHERRILRSHARGRTAR